MPGVAANGTFPEEPKRGAWSKEKTFAKVRWTQIGGLLRSESDNGKKPVKQIVFKGVRE